MMSTQYIPVESKDAGRFAPRKERVAAVDEKEELSVRKKIVSLGKKSEILTVTPDIAKTWLALMVINRHLRNEWVAAYARDMSRDEWRLNGSCIVFSSEGDIPDYESPGGKKHIPAGSLLDGQHRLWGCIDSKKEFTTLVVYGVDPAAFHTIDTGIARRPSDVLLGETSVNDLSATLRMLWIYKKGLSLGTTGSSTRITRKELMDLLDKSPGVRDAVARAVALSREVKLVPRSSLAFFLYVFSSKDKELGPRFIDLLQSGEGLHRTGKTAPVQILRKRLLKYAQQASRSPLVDRQAAVIKAWNLFRAGAESCSERALTWNRYGASPEKFPEIK